jgi:hypothetical protein
VAIHSTVFRHEPVDDRRRNYVVWVRCPHKSHFLGTRRYACNKMARRSRPSRAYTICQHTLTSRRFTFQTEMLGYQYGPEPACQTATVDQLPQTFSPRKYKSFAETISPLYPSRFPGRDLHRLSISTWRGDGRNDAKTRPRQFSRE